jgi:hypothetical protein
LELFVIFLFLLLACAKRFEPGDSDWCTIGFSRSLLVDDIYEGLPAGFGAVGLS